MPDRLKCEWNEKDEYGKLVHFIDKKIELYELDYNGNIIFEYLADHLVEYIKRQYFGR